MLLNRLDTLRVRAADGLTSTADRAELDAAGVDALALRREQSILRALIAESLDAGRVPELADDVIGAIGIDDDLMGPTSSCLRQSSDVKVMRSPPTCAPQVRA